MSEASVSVATIEVVDEQLSIAEARRRARMVVAYAEVSGLLPADNDPGISIERFNAAVRALAGNGVLRHLAPLPPDVSPEGFARAAKVAYSATEESPVPSIEWPAMHNLLEGALCDLVGVSPSSLSRYMSGARPTPAHVAARLHAVALIVRDLAGSYNEFGIQRWFLRPRAALGGKPPAAMLSGDWDPDDTGPRKVRQLAAQLVG